jgi:hypothetical protein
MANKEEAQNIRLISVYMDKNDDAGFYTLNAIDVERANVSENEYVYLN